MQEKNKMLVGKFVSYQREYNSTVYIDMQGTQSLFRELKGE